VDPQAEARQEFDPCRNSDALDWKVGPASPTVNVRLTQVDLDGYFTTLVNGGDASLAGIIGL
jgi:hypothetical protein